MELVATDAPDDGRRTHVLHGKKSCNVYLLREREGERERERERGREKEGEREREREEGRKGETPPLE